jgi:UPF0716 protein FxsA
MIPFLFFVVAPLIELAVIVEVGMQIGVWNTVGLLILAALLGAWLIRRRGMTVFGRFAQTVQSGQVPTRDIADDVCVLAAGVLLLLPGFIGDVVALFLLFPPTRAPVRKWIMNRRTLGGLGRVKVIRATYDGRISNVTEATDVDSTEIRGELDP